MTIWICEGHAGCCDPCELNDHTLSLDKPEMRSEVLHCLYDGGKMRFSHSSPPAAPRPPCEECIYQARSEEEKATIRNQTLDEVWKNVDCCAGSPSEADEEQCINCSLAMTHVGCYDGNPLDTREMFDGCLIESLRTPSTQEQP